MDTLLKSREHIKSTINRVWSFAQSIPEDTLTEALEVRLDRLEDAWRDFCGNQFDLHQYHAEDGYVDPEPEFETFEDQFIAAKALLVKLLREKTPGRDSFGGKIPPRASVSGNGQVQDSFENNNSVSNMAADYNTSQTYESEARASQKQRSNLANSESFSNGAKSSAEIELPAFKITPFAGDYREWPCFRDMFLGSIDCSKNLSSAQKFRYLKTFLRDEPANLLNGIYISDANYVPAWDKLERRYNRPLYIINQFIETYLNITPVLDADSRQLRKLIDNADEVVRGLDALQADGRDPWLIYLLINKTDIDTRKSWALMNKSSEDSTVNELIEFLEERCSALESSELKFKANKTHTRPTNVSGRVRSLTVATQTCPKCKCNHPLYQCTQFIAMSVENRRRFTRDQRLCYNCLGTNHSSSRCRAKTRCSHCQLRHHSLVHLDRVGSVTPDADGEPPHVAALVSQPIPSMESHHTMPNSPISGILPTVVVKVLDVVGNPQLFRALLDTGSQVSFVTDRAVRILGFSRRHARLPISGISAVNAGVTQGVVSLQLHSHFDTFSMNVEAYVLKTITSLTTPISFDFKDPLPLKDLQLADPGFNTPGPIDILLGSDRVWMSLRDGHRSYNSGNIFAQNTAFGWVISGKMPKREIVSMHVGADVDAILKSFWEIEEIRSHIPIFESAEETDNHFENTFSRAPDSKFIVELPFRQTDVRFANTLSGAISRFLSLERRFSKDEGLRDEYCSFMKVYEELGHMERIPDEEIEPTSGKVFYLPHHAVVTNKMRVVFNGSCRDSKGISLNEVLHIGPPLQRKLLNVYMQFRLYRYVFCADIVKMFRQIWVSPKHRDFQRIVWRESPSDPIGHFRLSTVTYGTAPAPFLAIRVLRQLAKDYQHQFPMASCAILKNSYVDDFAAGSDSVSGVLELKKQLVGILSCGGLELSKWSSNCWEILSTTENDQTVSLDPGTEWKKVLGIVWNPYQDVFAYKIALGDPLPPTKRNLLSEVSKIFDPMGFLAPSTILFKMLFQNLWLSPIRIDWDDSLPPEVAEKWILYRQQLKCFEQLKILRRYTLNSEVFDLIGFSDASEKAYSAVIYARSVAEDGHVEVHVVAAKCRVAPVKQISIPRLELCGALLLSRLMKFVCSSLDVVPGNIFAFSDSTIVLAWLSSPPCRWNTFVANRTAEILDNLPRSVWNHVRSEDNPADCASRGVEPSKLVDLELWWRGPVWISLETSQWPAVTVKEVENAPEKKKGQVAVLASTPEIHFLDELLVKISSWTRLVRIVAFVLRFAWKRKNQPKRRYFGYLCVAELRSSKEICLKFCQNEFRDEIQMLKQHKQLPLKSKLSSLSPFLDEVGLLRVGGRLSKAPNIPFSIKHPIVLPKNHHISQLILSGAHKVFLHAGVSELFSVIRQEYWIIGARNMIRKVVHDCLACFRLRSSTSAQLMGNLPSSRLSPSFPFAETGCDYAGPILLRSSKLRKAKLTKGYFALFVCMATKALHLEVVSDLSTDAFIAALRRFIARRGKCSVIHSDNGTNFQGAARKLSEVYELIRSSKHNELVLTTLAAENIEWQFIPPHAPHFGGLWESGIKCVKQHLYRITGNNILTFEEMGTLLAQIEALLNSRPLNAISDTDLNPLTPSHFLIGRPYTAIPEPCYSEVPINRLGRWELIQNMLQGFWKKWQMDYITSLQQRPKWKKVNRDFKLGDLVMVKEPNLPPSQWALGRIEELHAGQDGYIRVVTLRTKNGLFKRPITKLALLPIS